jgi:hypothetical protein
MDYTQFEKELCEKLDQAGWIQSWHTDRDGTSIEWSEIGVAHKAAFIEEINKIFPCHTDELKKLLKAFGQYHGMIEMSELEKIKSRASWMISEGPYLLVICDSRGNAEYALFQSRDDDAAYQLMLAAIREEKEIIILESRWLMEGKFPRLTPFGARGYWIKE